MANALIIFGPYLDPEKIHLSDAEELQDFHLIVLPSMMMAIIVSLSITKKLLVTEKVPSTIYRPNEKSYKSTRELEMNFP